MSIWNPWHGCHKISPGCAHCYMYRRDAMYNKNSNIVTKTSDFMLPLKKNRQHAYKLDSSPVYTCMTSDFFVEEADEWRKEAWQIMKIRSDLCFYIITKRIDRFNISLPDDWGDGYENVTICSTCENQKAADYRMPIFLNLPIKRKEIICEPMLEKINIEKYLKTGQIKSVTCGGESGDDARICDYDWILAMREQCEKYDVNFHFKQTGAKFKKGRKIYIIPRKFQIEQAKKAGIDL